MTGACFVVEARLERHGATCWDRHQGFPEDHWKESLEVFGSVRLLARVRDSPEAPGSRVSLPPEVEVVEMPHYEGLGGMLRRGPTLVRAALRHAGADAAFVLRVPGFLPILMWLALGARRRPYVVEVLGDGDQTFRFVEHWLRPLLRFVFARSQRSICRGAAAVLYVSHALERAFPAGAPAFTTVASDVRLPDAAFRAPREFTSAPEPARVVHIGNMEQPYKGHETLLRALASCAERGLRVRATLVGDGRHRGRFEALARELGLADLVEFKGTLGWGAPIFDVLDAADLFVFPSLTEGLGKALIEAMARGLPALGSAVGGIPELLDGDALVPPDDPPALAQALCRFLTDPALLSRHARINHQRALGFRDEVLEPRRLAFYRVARERLLGRPEGR